MLFFNLDTWGARFRIKTIENKFGQLFDFELMLAKSPFVQQSPKTHIKCAFKRINAHHICAISSCNGQAHKSRLGKFASHG